MSVTLMLVVSLVPAALLAGALVLGACRSSADADRRRDAALARIRVERRAHRDHLPY